MRYLICLIIAFVFSINHASAVECGGFGSLFERRPMKCQCGNYSKSFKPVSPYKNMKLAAVCDYREHRHENSSLEIHGHFFFRGEQIFSGHLKREESDFVTEFTFQGEKIFSSPPFYDDFVSLRFEDPGFAEKEFKAPKLSDKSPCWMTEAKLKVTEILSLPGDNDESGHYARKYTALEIKPYRKCPAK